MGTITYILFFYLSLITSFCQGEYVTSPVRPLYECDHLDQSITLSNWYSSCKRACSPYSDVFNLSVRIYRDPRESYVVDVFQIHFIVNQVSSHTDVFNNCNFIRSSHLKNLKDDDILDITRKISKAVEEYPNNTTLIVESPVQPDCSYFSDKYVSYDSIIAIKMPGKIMYDEKRRGDIKVPSLSMYIKAGSQWSRHGDTVVFWAYRDQVPNNCPLTSLGEHRCVNRTDTAIIECPLTGMLFHILETGVSVCSIPNLIYGGNGYYIDVYASQQLSSGHYNIKEGAITLQDNKLVSIISQMNKVYGEYTDMNCESICDISEQIFSLSDVTPSVIETPIGPWVSSKLITQRNHQVYVLSPCRRVSNWRMKSPLILCNGSSGVFIEDQGKNTEIWDPAKTYFLPGQTCADFSYSETELRILANETVRLHFWGKDMILKPPYSELPTWEDNGGGVYRSSKWMPYIHGVDLNLTQEIKVFLDEFHAHTKRIIEVRGKIRPFSIMTTVSKLAGDLWEGISLKVSEITDLVRIVGTTISMMLKIIPVLIVLLVLYYTIRISVFLFNIRGGEARTRDASSSRYTRERGEGSYIINELLGRGHKDNV